MLSAQVFKGVYTYGKHCKLASENPDFKCFLSYFYYYSVIKLKVLLKHTVTAINYSVAVVKPIEMYRV